MRKMDPHGSGNLVGEETEVAALNAATLGAMAVNVANPRPHHHISGQVGAPLASVHQIGVVHGLVCGQTQRAESDLAHRGQDCMLAGGRVLAWTRCAGSGTLQRLQGLAPELLPLPYLTQRSFTFKIKVHSRYGGVLHVRKYGKI